MLTNQDFLKEDQYRDASNLDARASLHARYSTNPYGWHRWVFDRFEIPEPARVLELGCGPAWLWEENVTRVPSTWHVTLSDLSAGMLETARAKFSGRQGQFRFEVVDAQEIPFEDNSFDAVIANHMLYHVPDRARAIAEVHRVLHPGGYFYAATNGEAHLRELNALFARSGLPDSFGPTPGREFSLENGTEQIARQFAEVRLMRYPDALVVNEAAPLVAYARSVVPKGQGEQALAEFARLIEAKIAGKGAVDITKDSGLFVARKA